VKRSPRAVIQASAQLRFRTDLRNAGDTVVDEEVVIDGTLISSRSPDDLSAFCRAVVGQFAQAPAHAS
jgi:protease I